MRAAGVSVQCPAVRTRRGAISVPLQVHIGVPAASFATRRPTYGWALPSRSPPAVTALAVVVARARKAVEARTARCLVSMTCLLRLRWARGPGGVLWQVIIGTMNPQDVPPQQVLTLPGPIALSPFRLEKLLASLPHAVAQAISPDARFMHFVALSEPLGPGETGVLEKLLTYGTSA